MRSLLRCFLLFLLLIPGVVSAHPHSWIDLKTSIQGTEKEITGFRMEWTFDAMTSVYMIDGADLSEANREASLQSIADEMLTNMLGDHYFTYFYNGEDPIRYKRGRNAKLSMHRGKAVFSFDLPLSQPQPLTASSIKLLIFEPSYYVDMSWKETEDVVLSGALAKSCKLELVEPNPTAEQMSYALSLPMDADPDNTLGQLFTQKVMFNCKGAENLSGGSGE
ncbi:DUF1007 family protein [Vibrio sp. JC009]|nr:DUF1007 family protein [Vibrio sp. JC009]WED23319.1 DUF1007 family protein [Vibrio sp. JC009]